MTRGEAIKVLSSYDVNGVWADIDGKPYNAEEQAEAFDMAIEALQAEPVKHGEWQAHFDSFHATFEMRCSLCDYRLYMPQIDQFLQTSFCPNCGAKMKGIAGK